MGRYYFDKKDTVEDCRSISISFLRKNGFLRGFQSGWIVWRNRDGEETASMGAVVSTSNPERYMRLLYTMTHRYTGKKTDCDYKVKLVTTPCNLGGIRWWFICPLMRDGLYCGRRVGVLYRAPQADYYGCRHCHNLSYESRNERRYGELAYMGRYVTLSGRVRKLWEQTNRWTYRGMTTRKAQRLYALKARLDAYGKVHLAVADLLSNP